MSISAATVSLTIGQATLFPTPVIIQGFAADDVYDIDELRIGEVLMGVDGVLSSGFVNVEVPFTVALQADSASNLVFDTIALQSMAAQDSYPMTATIKIPSVGSKINLFNGTLVGWKPAPQGRRLLQPRRHRVTFGKIGVAPN